MSVKVKRGLGLLVVALMAWLIGLAAIQGDSAPAAVLAAATGLVMVLAGVAGLVMLAWGLLRD